MKDRPMNSSNEGTLCLTPAEIREITGKTQPAAQLRHLKRMGIRAERRDNPDAPVCVVREWLAVRPGPVSTATSRPKLRFEREQTAQASDGGLTADTLRSTRLRAGPAVRLARRWR
jgi:hypothetical protein